MGLFFNRRCTQMDADGGRLKAEVQTRSVFTLQRVGICVYLRASAVYFLFELQEERLARQLLNQCVVIGAGLSVSVAVSRLAYSLEMASKSASPIPETYRPEDFH